MIYLNSAVLALLLAPLINFFLAYYLSKKRQTPNRKILSESKQKLEVYSIYPEMLDHVDATYNPNFLKTIDNMIPEENPADRWFQGGENWVRQYYFDDDNKKEYHD